LKFKSVIPDEDAADFEVIRIAMILRQDIDVILNTPEERLDIYRAYIAAHYRVELDMDGIPLKVKYGVGKRKGRTS
jgi:predicted GTPase